MKPPKGMKFLPDVKFPLEAQNWKKSHNFSSLQSFKATKWKDAQKDDFLEMQSLDMVLSQTFARLSILKKIGHGSFRFISI